MILGRQIERLARFRETLHSMGALYLNYRSIPLRRSLIKRRQVLGDMLHGLLDGQSCVSTLATLDRLNRERQRVLATSRSPVRALAVRPDYN